MNDLDELQNFDPDNQPIVIYRKKGGFFGKLVAILLGVILGILVTVGGVAGVGWYIYCKAPIKNSMGTVNSLLGTDIDYGAYIDPSYGDKTLQNLVGDVLDAAQLVAEGKGSLSTFATISPLVEDIILGSGEEGDTGIIGLMNSYAIYPDPDAFMSRILLKPEGIADSDENANIYFTDYIKQCVDNAYLGDMMQAMGYELNDVIMNLCYGEENIDYIYDEQGNIEMINGAKKLTLKEFLSDDLNEQIQSLPVDSFVSVNFPDDAVMCMLAYGADYRYEKVLDSAGNVVMKQVFYEGSGDPFVLLDDEGNDVTANILAGADDPQNGILLQHAYTANGLEITERRYLQYNATDDKYYAFSDEACTTPIRFQKNTVGMLSDGSDSLIDGMYIKDLLSVDEKSERVLIAIAYGREDVDWSFDSEGKIQMASGKKARTVSDLKKGDIFNSLTLKDLLGDDVESNTILSKLADATLEELPDEMEKLTFEDIFADKIYEDEDHTVIKAMWTYLFDDPDTATQEGPDEYYILGGTSESTKDKKGVDAMVDNMQINIQTATIGKLVRDDLIVFEDDEDGSKKEDFLTNENQKKILVGEELQYVRDVTIIQMLNYILALS